MSRIQTQAALSDALARILSNPDSCKEALKNPAKVLEEYGVHVADPEETNRTLFTTLPQIRAHFVAGAAKKHDDPPMLGCESAKCIACKAGLNAAGAGIIAAAVAGWPEDMAVIAPVAELCGLSEAAVKAVFSALAAGGAVTVEAAITGLCEAMSAC